MEKKVNMLSDEAAQCPQPVQHEPEFLISTSTGQLSRRSSTLLIIVLPRQRALPASAFSTRSPSRTMKNGVLAAPPPPSRDTFPREKRVCTVNNGLPLDTPFLESSACLCTQGAELSSAENKPAVVAHVTMFLRHIG